LAVECFGWIGSVVDARTIYAQQQQLVRIC
jgi:hypothetical protein